MYVPDPRLLSDTLYDPKRERAACGVGFVADIDGRRTNQILRHALIRAGSLLFLPRSDAHS